MGQEQNNNNTANLSPSGSAGSGVTSSFSFLARKRNSTKASQIVTVNNNNSVATDEFKNDEDLKHIKEISRFLPILRGVLPAQRNPPEIFKKIDPRYILRFLQRLQYHFGICSQIVSEEQSSVSAKIVETDQFITSLIRRINDQNRKYETFSSEMKKAKALNEQIEKVQLQLQEIVQGLECLNDLLPDDERLPSLSTELAIPIRTKPDPEKNQQKNRIVPVEECVVVDQRMQSHP